VVEIPGREKSKMKISERNEPLRDVDAPV
jgi:hypothetical protein